MRLELYLDSEKLSYERFKGLRIDNKQRIRKQIRCCHSGVAKYTGLKDKLSLLF